MLQSIFFHTVSIFSCSYAALISCGNYTLTTGIILLSFPSVGDLPPFLHFLPEGVFSIVSHLLFLLTYYVLSLGLSYLLNRFSRIGS
jgi:hypothetical protein